jgi:hypothetical protein
MRRGWITGLCLGQFPRDTAKKFSRLESSSPFLALLVDEIKALRAITQLRVRGTPQSRKDRLRFTETLLQTKLATVQDILRFTSACSSQADP